MDQQYSYGEEAKKTSPYCKIIYALSLVGALAFAVLQHFQIKRYYNGETGLFGDGSSSSIIYIALAVFMLVSISAYFLIKRDGYPEEMKDGRAVRFSSALVFICLGADLAIRLATGVIPYLKAYTNELPALEILLIISSALSLAYFALIALGVSAGEGKGALMSLFGLILSAQMIFRVMSSYFGVSVSFNSPLWNLSTFAAMSLLMFFLFETRYWLDRSAPKFYYSAATAATLLNVLNGASLIARSNIALYGITGELSYAMFSLSAVLYIAARIFTK
ncbi:MAG: hypothetical protein E7623_01210 [Ruminococcaceae bacterium]|nr:hypothetical protein [Oscillospiraceae bacterium]